MSLQYLTDDSGNPQAAAVPLTDRTGSTESVRTFEQPSQTDDETEYLLSSPAMKQRLLKSRARRNEPAKSWEEVRDALGI